MISSRATRSTAVTSIAVRSVTAKPTPATSVTAKWVLGLTLLCVVATTFLASARHAEGALKRVSFEEIAVRSEMVATGKVVRLRSYREEVENVGLLPFTDVTIRVTGWLKRPNSTQEVEEITFRTLGGTLDGVRYVCPEAAHYEVNESVLVFLRRGADRRLCNTGWKQGKYRLSPDGTAAIGRPSLPIGRSTPLSTIRSQVALFSQQDRSSHPTHSSATLRRQAGPESSR